MDGQHVRARTAVLCQLGASLGQLVVRGHVASTNRVASGNDRPTSTSGFGEAHRRPARRRDRTVTVIIEELAAHERATPSLSGDQTVGFQLTVGAGNRVRSRDALGGLQEVDRPRRGAPGATGPVRGLVAGVASPLSDRREESLDASTRCNPHHRVVEPFPGHLELSGVDCEPSGPQTV